jgi:hypothetical protein
MPQIAQKQDEIDSELQGLLSLKRVVLIGLWKEQYGNPPPKFVSNKLLIRAIAYGIQVSRYGGLPTEIQKELLRIAALPKGRALVKAPTLSPGTRLVRNWHGRTFSVDVTETGFEWEGRAYRSLSQIARHITSTSRNGPQFFGVK